MLIEQLYTSCLSQGAYYIESNGEAAIIDPLREIDTYLEKAATRNTTIKYIFETHFHADFVSGHLSLSKATGAPIIYGPNAHTQFDTLIATDGQEFSLGNITIVALHTPGHTLESTTYLVRDAEGKEHAIFSGDTLFLGDVGRPDLAQKSTHLTQEQLAGMLYDSLRSKIMPLPDHVIVYPAHGAGSACGKQMSTDTIGTLGIQKQTNYALRADMSKEDFIQEVTDGLLPPPSYFPFNVQMNQEGYTDIYEIIQRGTTPHSCTAFATLIDTTSAIVLDVRHQHDFIRGHIPNSLFIGLDGSFAPWVGAILRDVQQPIVLVTPAGREQETVTRLARVGFDHTLGYLQGGFEAWKASGRSIHTISNSTAAMLAKSVTDTSIIIDVRTQAEYTNAHIRDAINIPLAQMHERIAAIPIATPFYIHCAGGYRSVIAASILAQQGIHTAINIEEGFKAIKNTSLPIITSHITN